MLSLLKAANEFLCNAKSQLVSIVPDGIYNELTLCMFLFLIRLLGAVYNETSQQRVIMLLFSVIPVRKFFIYRLTAVRSPACTNINCIPHPHKVEIKQNT